MYPGFAKTARDEGFDEVAEWLETLARAEKSHAGRFTQGLESQIAVIEARGPAAGARMTDAPTTRSIPEYFDEARRSARS